MTFIEIEEIFDEQKVDEKIVSVTKSSWDLLENTVFALQDALQSHETDEGIIGIPSNIHGRIEAVVHAIYKMNPIISGSIPEIAQPKEEYYEL